MAFIIPGFKRSAKITSTNSDEPENSEENYFEAINEPKRSAFERLADQKAERKRVGMDTIFVVTVVSVTTIVLLFVALIHIFL